MWNCIKATTIDTPLLLPRIRLRLPRVQLLVPPGS